MDELQLFNDMRKNIEYGILTPLSNVDVERSPGWLAGEALPVDRLEEEEKIRHSSDFDFCLTTSSNPS